MMLKIYALCSLIACIVYMVINSRMTAIEAKYHECVDKIDSMGWSFSELDELFVSIGTTLTDIPHEIEEEE